MIANELMERFCNFHSNHLNQGSANFSDREPQSFTNNVVEGHFDVTFRMIESSNPFLFRKYLLNISNLFSFPILNLDLYLSKVIKKHILNN